MTEKKQSTLAARGGVGGGPRGRGAPPPFIWNMKRIPVPAYKI